MLIVGLTGGIATGKSTASKILRDEFEIPVVDADVIARQVVEPGTAGYKKIVAHFSPLTPNLLHDDGTLNRPELGKVIFGDEKQRKVLNGIVHPAVRWEMFKQTMWAWVRGHRMVVLDVPLLFESRLDRFCGATVAVLCQPETELERLLKRDEHLTRELAEQRISSQMSLADKRGRADHVVDNDSDIESLKLQLSSVIHQLKPNPVLSTLEWLVPPLGGLVAILTAVYRLYIRPNPPVKQD